MLHDLDALVATGRWATRDDALRESLASLRGRIAAETDERDSYTPADLAAIEVGIAEADRGELIPAEEVFDRLIRRYAEWK